MTDTPDLISVGNRVIDNPTVENVSLDAITETITDTDIPNQPSEQVLQLKKKITQDIITETEKTSFQKNDIKVVKINSKSSKFIFLFVLFVFFGVLTYYVIVLLQNKNKSQDDTTNATTNYFFYNHTGWGPLTTSSPCYSVPVINGVLIYDDFFKKDCLDPAYITGVEAVRSCVYESDKAKSCVDFNNVVYTPTAVNSEITINYTIENADFTRLPTCNLKSCKGYVGRIISFLNKEPYCATITPFDNKLDSLVLDQTAFLPCDIANANQQFVIENVNVEDTKQDYFIRLFSRSMQKYLFIDPQGSLRLTDSSSGYWMYTPTVEINETTKMPSQLTYIDFAKMTEYSKYPSYSDEIVNYSVFSDNETNFLKLKITDNYYDYLINLYGLSPTGYLSSRQYVQFCNTFNVGNKACYDQIMIIRETDYVKNPDNIVYKYTGVSEG